MSISQQFCDLCNKTNSWLGPRLSSVLGNKIKRQEPQGFDSNNPIHWLATGFGTGLTDKMPGTCGSLVGALLMYVLAGMNVIIAAIVLGFLILIAIQISDLADKDFTEHDSGHIVIDEIVGLGVVGLFISQGIIMSVIAFGIFRLFDILKPWPIRALERRIGGGLGIVVDDLVAGLIAGLIMLGLRIVF
jgi:phosphatidylglycerophosphatase A